MRRYGRRYVERGTGHPWDVGRWTESKGTEGVWTNVDNEAYSVITTVRFDDGRAGR